MTMGNLFKNLPAHPFVKLDHSLLVTGGAEVAALTRKNQKMFHDRILYIGPGAKPL